MSFQSEIETLIRARYPILYVITSEEMRLQNLLVEIAAKRQKKLYPPSLTPQRWHQRRAQRRHHRQRPSPEADHDYPEQQSRQPQPEYLATTAEAVRSHRRQCRHQADA